MSRSEYYNYIDEKLHVLAYRITTGGKLNMLGLHMHSENFYFILELSENDKLFKIEDKQNIA